MNRRGWLGWVVAAATFAAFLGTAERASAQVPMQCDFAPGTAWYGPISVGTAIVLGRHGPWRGDDNWTPAMDQFVGRVAVVTTLSDVDPSGCPGVRVDIDGGQYFWRIRDAQLAPQTMLSIPTSCDMTDSTAYYGPITVGSTVILGRHTPWRGDDNWTPEMGRWALGTAMVTQLSGVDSVGCPGVRVDVDGGRFFWRIRDMSLPGVVLSGGAGVAVRETYQPGYTEEVVQEWYPVPYSARPLTLARGMLSPYVAGGVTHITVPDGFGGTRDEWLGSMDAGLSFGATDFLEITLDALPLQLSPTVEYGLARGGPWLGLTALYARTTAVDMGIRFGLNLPVRDPTRFYMGLSIPFLFHFGRVGRLDLDPGFLFLLTDPGAVLLDINGRLTFNIGDYVFLGARSGIGGNLDNFDRNFAVPLGFYLGATVPGDEGPIADISGDFSFPILASGVGDTNTDVWALMFNVRFYTYLYH